MAIDPTSLHIELEEQEGWRRRLTVTVPAGTVQAERDKVLQQLGSRIRLPGFRKGKIPPRVVEQRFGAAVDRETLDQVIREAYREALRARQLEPISEGELEAVDYRPREDLTFSISFDVRPTLQLARLGGFTLERPKIEVTEEEVERVLARLQEQNGVWKPVEEGPAEEGNLVSLEVQRLSAGGEPEGDAKSYEVVLGAGEVLPQVEEALRNIPVGSSGEVQVSYPDDYPNEALRGRSQRLRIQVRGRKVRELPPLDDAFARSVGDFADLAALRARIREDLEREAQNEADRLVRSQLMDRILEANPFQVPRSMVDRYLDTLLGDTSKLDPEAVARTRESLRPEAERGVKRILVVERVAELQGLRATEAELDERIQAVASRNNTHPAQLYARLQKSGALERMEREITEDKVYRFLLSQSTVRDL